jgi:hypothetical protein
VLPNHRIFITDLSYKMASFNCDGRHVHSAIKFYRNTSRQLPLLELQGQRPFQQLDKTSDTQFAFSLLDTFLPALIIGIWIAVPSATQHNSPLTQRLREPAVPLQRSGRAAWHYRYGQRATDQK